MRILEGPFELTQDTCNTLEIGDKNGVLVCQFYEDDDNVSDATRAKAKYVVDALNERWERNFNCSD